MGKKRLEKWQLQNIEQYFTLPHMSYRTIRSPDGSQIVTWSTRRTPLDSIRLTVDPDVSQIVTWSVRRTPLDSTGIKADSCLERGIHLSPPDCARLCQTGLFWSQKWQWSPKRCVQWNLLDWSTFKKHTTYISDICWWTVPDCAGLDSSGVQRGVWWNPQDWSTGMRLASTGIRRNG